MADIKVKNLATQNISGNNLFDDSESFMMEISDEIEQVTGGRTAACLQPTCADTECIRHSNIVCADALQ
jgi:hypothetical protein